MSAWGEGSAREAAYDLIDEAIRDLQRRSLDEFRYLLAGRDDIGSVRDEIGNLRVGLQQQRESESFPWDRVRLDAVFVHSRYLSADRQPEKCRIYKLTYSPDRAIEKVFYEVGGPAGDQVYNLAAEFPAAVKAWA
jgi:hypothetical protein